MVGSNVLVNILKPVNIVNLGNTLRCGVGRSEVLVTEPMASFQVRGSAGDHTSHLPIYGQAHTF